MLEIIAKWKFPCCLPRFAQYAVTESILKTKSRSRKMTWYTSFAFIVAHGVLLNVVCSCFISTLCIWNSCRIGKVAQPRTPCLFINWAACLKRLRTPAVGGRKRACRSEKGLQPTNDSCFRLDDIASCPEALATWSRSTCDLFWRWRSSCWTCSLWRRALSYSFSSGSAP